MEADYVDGLVIDCKHEKPGNQTIRLENGVWGFNIPDMHKDKP